MNLTIQQYNTEYVAKTFRVECQLHNRVRRMHVRTKHQQALNADVPEGWVTGEGEGEYQGLVYYYNEATGESTWDHPLDDFYRCPSEFLGIQVDTSMTRVPSDRDNHVGRVQYTETGRKGRGWKAIDSATSAYCRQRTLSP